MNNNPEHYSSEFPNVKVKIHTISESLRRHLYFFKTVTGVFSFGKIDLGTKILVEHMVIPEEPGVLLDLGCGYGPIGIVLGHESPESLVFLIDVNKHAIWCARENVKLNLMNNRNIRILSGNYFEPIKSKNIKFDGIFMNPPLRQGRKEFLYLIHIIPNYLKSDGSFQFVIKKKMGAPFVLNYLKSEFPNKIVEVLCKRSGYWVFRCFQGE
ncbi:MAG: class I SAM-dependent methyltransferase [Promethearchaeota archaeon]|jgi:16S rRNA (guanine1207-N2)-methyltransferase